jgi:hypothetical protein
VEHLNLDLAAETDSRVQVKHMVLAHSFTTDPHAQPGQTGCNLGVRVKQLDNAQNKQILVRDDALSEDITVDLLSYISIALRWEMWGEVPPPPDGSNFSFDGRWPFKHVGGFGLRIHSTVSPEAVQKIYASRIVYMGCMH